MKKDPILTSPLPANRAEACSILRTWHPKFYYEDFELEAAPSEIRVKFHFRIEPDIEFSPEIVIEGIGSSQAQSLPKGVLENFVFHLGLVEMLSYWKAACSPEIVVHAGALDSEQIVWWMDLLACGMGEFFYVNKIHFDESSFVKITSENGGERLPRFEVMPSAGRDTVLTSGGKDSVVTLEFLKKAGREFDCLLLNPAPAALAVARQAGCAMPVVVRRTIDPRLLELNAAGYLNGHTPFSALLAFLGATVAVLRGSPHVIVSNERSAEEAAAEFLGREVNHQYSKSFRFEAMFRAYSQKYLAAGLHYFSLLRPLYELQIAALFARCNEYFPLFRSCNRGMTSNTWCGRCPKCLFVYTALYPFVERDQMLAIFGQDLFAWEEAEAILRALLGLDRDKPFECVGTREETMAALYLCAGKYREQRIALPSGLRAIEETVLSQRKDMSEVVSRVLGAWTDRHHLPPELAAVLHEKVIRR